MSGDPITGVFVYGTLQRGQCRAAVWPRPPLQIQGAVVTGQLYDLGEYPALVLGDLSGGTGNAASDRVAGELWSLDPYDVAQTLAVLDRVEGYRRQPTDLYHRCIVACRCRDGRQRLAFTYVYAQVSDLSQAQRIAVDQTGIASWPSLT